MNAQGVLLRRYADLRGVWEQRTGRPITISHFTNFALDAMDEGRSDLAVALLEPMSQVLHGDASLWQILGLALRDEQRMEEAIAALGRAQQLAPQDVRIAAGLGQATLETGRPAATLFQKAVELSGGHPDMIRSTAAALALEGAVEAADTLLKEAVQARADWIEGHELLVQIRWRHGERERHVESLRAAIERHPRHGGLRMALYRALMTVKAHAAAKQVLDETLAALDEPAFRAAASVWEAEHGDRERAYGMVGALPARLQAQIRLTHIRLLMRTGRWKEAEHLATSALATPERNAVWPYLSTIWRLRDDPRAAWLDGAPPYIATQDLGLSGRELSTLATVLRELHAHSASFPAQSVRGGTQTDQPLFHRQEPEIRRVRAAVLEALGRYIDKLPPAQVGHPLLDTAREQLLFEGSWSVLLQANGHHSTHTHPHGWISAVCYIDRPPADMMGAAPAGWLELGTPPPELGLSLAPYQRIEPVVGRIALFPSTMWHRTIGFEEGERLTIAFDVKPPRY